MPFSRGPFPSTADLDTARRVLLGYHPVSQEQRETLELILAFINAHPENAHRRTCLSGHLTGSGFVLDHLGGRALLTHHRKLGRWLQLGGHADGDANLPGVALREATEESGINDLKIDPIPIDLDIHLIPARPGEPEHLHFDTRFLIRADPQAVARVGEESLDLRWFAPDELDGVETDNSVRRLFRIAFG